MALNSLQQSPNNGIITYKRKYCMKRKNENKFMSKLTEYRMAVSTRRIRIVASMQPTDDGRK